MWHAGTARMYASNPGPNKQAADLLRVLQTFLKSHAGSQAPGSSPDSTTLHPLQRAGIIGACSSLLSLLQASSDHNSQSRNDCADVLR